MSLKSKLSVILAVASALLLVPGMAFAQEANKWEANKWVAPGAGFAIGLAVLGGALGQGRAAAAALEGISRNPGAAARIQTPMILGLALIESLVLFAFLIAFLLMQKVAGV
jgi:F-type H+-transporting ATPase subunit c